MTTVPPCLAERVQQQQAMLRRHWGNVTGAFVEFPREALERSIVERFEYIAERHADRVAVKAKEATLTYASLNGRANRLARAVNARLGDANEPVALLFERGSAAIAAMFGILKAGKIYVALDPTYPFERIKLFLADSECRLILTNEHNLELARRLASQITTTNQPDVLSIEEISQSLRDDNLNLVLSPDSYASLIYTSGSTGQPKGAIQDHRQILHHTMTLTNHYRICPEDRQPQFFSYSYSVILSSVYPTLLNGAMLIPSELDAVGIANLADWLVENRVTLLHLLPQVYRQFFASLPAPDPNRMPQLRLIAVGGGTLTAQDIALWLSHLSPDCVISHSLATTEVIGTARLMMDHDTPLTFEIVPVGYPEPDKEILLVDENGLPVELSSVGEIVVKCRYMTPGYWRKPDLTGALFKPDPDGSDKRLYYSGDMGRWRQDGALEMVGRKDFQVKIRGFTVQIGEVEMALYDLGSIKEAVVIAVPDDKGNQRLAAYLVSKIKPEQTVGELRAGLKERLPRHAIPATFVYLDALPRTPNGKVDRTALAHPTSLRPHLAQPYVPAQDDLQSKLVQIWQDVLGIHPIGIHDDFFDLGGDSLAAEMLSLELQSKLGKNLSAPRLLEAPTIEKLALLLVGRSQTPTSSCIVAIQPEGSNPPLFLAHGIGGGLVHHATLARLLGSDQPVYGIQQLKDAETGSESFESIVQHYVDALVEFRPSGPYLLAGYSYGAAVAYEMARQLEQRGRPVAFLGIFDYTLALGFRRIKFGPRFVLGFINNLPHWLNGFRQLDPKLQRATIARWTGRFCKAFQKRQDVVKVMMTTELTELVNAIGPMTQEQLEHIERDWVRVKRHAFQSYSGPLTLFRARALPIVCSFDPAMNWRELVQGDISVEIVPGMHADLLHERNIHLVAAKVKRCLDRVLAANDGTGS